MSFNKDTNMYVGYIYKIVNNINDKIYIGQTTTTLRDRWYGHLSAARMPNPSMAISRAIKKYGENNFNIIELLEIGCATKEELADSLNAFEILLIREYETLIDNKGYNISYGGKLRVDKNKPVAQYDFYGNLIAVYDSGQDASIATGISKSKICRCCTNTAENVISAGGFIWCHLGDEPPLYKKHRMRPIDEYTLDGTLVKTYNNISEITDSKRDRDTLYGCLNGSNIQWNNRIWRYHGDSFDKYRTSFKNGNKKRVVAMKDNIMTGVYDSIKEAAEKTNSCYSCVQQCCRGKRKMTNNMQFYFYDDIDITQYETIV